MKFKTYKISSSHLIMLGVIILCLGFIMTYFIYSTIERLKYDASLINNTGIIRGSIQRVTKLILYNPAQLPSELITDINNLMESIVSNNQRSIHKKFRKSCLTNINKLNTKWQYLRGLLIKYQKTHLEKMRKEIIKESENCWFVADEVVLEAQFANENKVAGIKLFYIMLILNFISAILVIVLVFFYVRKKIEFESLHDSLTELLNRRSYDNTIDLEISRSKRYNRSISIILFDIDYFKNINDTYGHKVGDSVLINLAKVIVETIRKTDSVFRVGGEEFVIISPESKAQDVFTLSEKIRNKIENYSFESDIKVTISLGIAEFYSGITKDELYHQADQALYLSKNKGRNCSTIFK